jgi:FixJ family two-component response regulator
LSYLEAGQPNKVIVRHLDMAEATVKVHLKAQDQGRQPDPSGGLEPEP